MSLQSDCPICDRRSFLTEMRQILPCLHIFCRDCTNIWSEISKICPASDCYSPLKLTHDQKWNPCNNDLCLYRLMPTVDLYKLSACKHELCANCYDDAARPDRMMCPLPMCGKPMSIVDLDECDGSCHKPLDPTKTVHMVCCGGRFCHECFSKMFDSAQNVPLLESKEQHCPRGRCLEMPELREHKNRRINKSTQQQSLSKCNGLPDCNREALRNFPSEMECDHEVCLHCVDKMIGECHANDCLPMCPNEQCRLPYRFESVVALRALLPERAKYFAGLALDVQHGYVPIRDDKIDSSDLALNSKTADRQFEIRCGVSEDEEGPQTVIFTKSGTLGEFIREIRRTLRILPTEKVCFVATLDVWLQVYGYFIRREDGEDELLPVTPITSQKFISEFRFDPESVIIVDMSGIVMSKSGGHLFRGL
ncbi:RING-type domain-containing protein [Aphelenchoides besseyi]|nr:RING-type domain-containing protein [Aphelenchoides besseyi]